MRICILAAGLHLAGCDAPEEHTVPAEKPVVPVNKAPLDAEQVDAGAQESTAPVPGEKPGETVHKPLDLTMPPQNAEDRDSFPGRGPAPSPLLPDLFEHQSKQNERSINLRGKVLMDKEGEQKLDSFEGGQLIIEMKNR